MIIMLVGYHNSIEVVYLCPKHLLPEVRTYINNHISITL